MPSLQFRVQQLAYDLASGLFARPAAWIAALAFAALALPPLESRVAPGLSAFLATEPASAQVVLGTLAGSMMTVVSVVYSILLVALSLASIQFSTRILASMMRDRVAQNTLGLFVGTFVYCLLVLRAVHGDPQPYVPGVALTGAIALALFSLAGLVWFIHHIVSSIQANHLVDRIASETEAVIDDVFREALLPGEVLSDPALPPVPEGAAVVLSNRSGYIQLIDTDSLAKIAERGHAVFLLRPMGSFVAAGTPLFALSPPASPELELADLRALDIGPMRTMQRDVEFGVRQIVDIALKAISPAVNDPSTAVTCIDQLGRLLVRVAGRRPAPVQLGGVVVPMTTHAALIDLAFDQIRQYGRADMAVALRLVRVLGELAAVTTQPASLARIQAHARMVAAAARAAFPAEDCEELERRLEGMGGSRQSG